MLSRRSESQPACRATAPESEQPARAGAEKSLTAVPGSGLGRQLFSVRAVENDQFNKRGNRNFISRLASGEQVFGLAPIEMEVA